MPESQFNYCHSGQVWQLEGVKIQVLSPKQQQLTEVTDNQNELSCVLYVQVQNAQPYANFLLMGDAGWEAEYQILKDYPDLKVMFWYWGIMVVKTVRLMIFYNN